MRMRRTKVPGSDGFSGGAAYRNRTDDLRITRGLLPGRARASCTDGTDHRIHGTLRAGIIRRPGPRTGPRPRPRVLLLHVNVADDKDPRLQADTASGPTVDLHAATHTVRLADAPDLHDIEDVTRDILMRGPGCH